MKETKERRKFFEKPEITELDYAQALLEKENKKFKFKLICTGISILPSIFWLVAKWLPSNFFGDCCAIIAIIGWIATIICNPLGILKTMAKFTYFGLLLVPIVFFNIFAAAIGFVLALMLLIYAPVVYCLFGLYQSYLNKQEAEEFLYLNKTL